MSHKTVEVLELPECDICKMLGLEPEPAEYDGRTKLGQWGYMCETHFWKYGVGLGLGRGQKLVKAK